MVLPVVVVWNLEQKKAGSFIVEGRYYFALSDFYSTTKKDYFALQRMEPLP